MKTIQLVCSRNVISVFILFFLTTSMSNAVETVKLKDAIKLGKIKSAMHGNSESPHYMKPLILELENLLNEPVIISVETGLEFNAVDTNYQDLIVVQAELISLKPVEKKAAQIFSMCTKLNRSGPITKVPYEPSSMAEGGMMQIAQFIEKNKYFDNAGQDAVWVFSDNHPIEDIGCMDATETRLLQEKVCAITGKKMEIVKSADRKTEYRRYHTESMESEMGGDFSYKIPHPASVYIAMFDKNGIVVRELYRNASVSAGAHTFEFKFDASVYTEPFYYFKLIVDNDIKVSRKLETN